MVKKRCDICGTELQETTLGNLWCPNHGIVFENPKNQESEENKSDYIG